MKKMGERQKSPYWDKKSDVWKSCLVTLLIIGVVGWVVWKLLN